jgi:hypothetical protein
MGGAMAATGGGVVLLAVALVVALFTYFSCKVEVPASHVAVLIKKTGADLPTELEIAPDRTYKGVQLDVLKEGRTYLNPMNWEWEVQPQIEVPEGKVGVVVRLFGEDLPISSCSRPAPTRRASFPER